MSACTAYILTLHCKGSTFLHEEKYLHDFEIIPGN